MLEQLIEQTRDLYDGFAFLASSLIPKYHINTQTTDNVSSLYFQRKTTGVSLTSLR
jgi:hypothetical protein